MARPLRDCLVCGGDGYILDDDLDDSKCDACEGTGKIPYEPCTHPTAKRRFRKDGTGWGCIVCGHEELLK